MDWNHTNEWVSECRRGRKVGGVRDWTLLKLKSFNINRRSIHIDVRVVWCGVVSCHPFIEWRRIVCVPSNIAKDTCCFFVTFIIVAVAVLLSGLWVKFIFASLHHDGIVAVNSDWFRYKTNKHLLTNEQTKKHHHSFNYRFLMEMEMETNTNV